MDYWCSWCYRESFVFLPPVFAWNSSVPSTTRFTGPIHITLSNQRSTRWILWSRKRRRGGSLLTNRFPLLRPLQCFSYFLAVMSELEEVKSVHTLILRSVERMLSVCWGPHAFRKEFLLWAAAPSALLLHLKKVVFTSKLYSELDSVLSSCIHVLPSLAHLEASHVDISHQMNKVRHFLFRTHTFPLDHVTVRFNLRHQQRLTFFFFTALNDSACRKTCCWTKVSNRTGSQNVGKVPWMFVIPQKRWRSFFVWTWEKKAFF